jgi:hypothetical protein
MTQDPVAEAIRAAQFNIAEGRLAAAYAYLRIALEHYQTRIAELEDRYAAEQQAHQATIAHCEREHG